ncbi:hypothetical protein E2562_017815 [Oryza meyeriana var. granulata]|uniref:Oxidoreductase N-terminal domain-containing protein n=1 Tax=Oryza meyeriana var. granulata TaxID=110450 RepID=A0A6G1BM02_9ORYZ|nr:hypothetical protein E2562_017815 [Oryza meyeriana var. granulata]
MRSAAAAAVSNRRVILMKRYVTTGLVPSEHDMEVVTAKAPPVLAVSARSSAVAVKNLYVLCDPYMRSQMAATRRPATSLPPISSQER